jgi:hypothetical protein
VLNGREVPEPFDVEPFVAGVVDGTLSKRNISLSYHRRQDLVAYGVAELWVASPASHRLAPKRVPHALAVPRTTPTSGSGQRSSVSTLPLATMVERLETLSPKAIVRQVVLPLSLGYSTSDVASELGIKQRSVNWVA